MQTNEPIQRATNDTLLPFIGRSFKCYTKLAKSIRPGYRLDQRGTRYKILALSIDSCVRLVWEFGCCCVTVLSLVWYHQRSSPFHIRYVWFASVSYRFCTGILEPHLPVRVPGGARELRISYCFLFFKMRFTLPAELIIVFYVNCSFTFFYSSLLLYRNIIH